MWKFNHLYNRYVLPFPFVLLVHGSSLSSDYWEAMSKVRNVDVNVVSGTLKLYLRELPEPLIPAAYFQSLSKAMGESLPLALPHSRKPSPTHTS